MADKFVLGLEDIQRDSDELNRQLEDKLRSLPNDRVSDKVPRHPEQTLDSILLTINDVSANEAPTDDVTIDRTLGDNDTLVREGLAEPKKEAIIDQRNNDKGSALQGELSDQITTAMNAPNDEVYQTAMRRISEKVKEVQDFNLRTTGASTSILDVISDMSEKDVQQWGISRTIAMQGFVSLFKKLEDSSTDGDEELVKSFIEAIRAVEVAIIPTRYPEGGFPELPKRIDPNSRQQALGIGSPLDKKFRLDFQEEALNNLIALSETRAFKFMADHPYITSFLIDGSVVAISMVGTPAAGFSLKASTLALRSVLSKAGLRKLGKKKTLELLAKEVGMKKVELAAALMAARMPAATQIGLGLGAVYLAGEMLEDGSSKTAAFLTEVFGPMAVITMFNWGKTPLISYLRRLSVKNNALFTKLNKGLANSKDLLGKEFVSNMRTAVETQSEIIGKTTKDLAADVVSKEMSPPAKLLANSNVVDKKAANSIVDMIEFSMKGNGAQADAIRNIIGLDNLEGLTASARIAEVAKIQFNIFDDVDAMVQLMKDAPAMGATFRGVGAKLDTSIDLIQKKIKSTPFTDGKNALRKELAQAQELQKSFKETAVKFDLDAFDRNSAAFMQTPLAKLLFADLPQYQGMNGKILYKQLANNFASPPIGIEGETYRFVNTNLRQLESGIKELTFDIQPGVWGDSGKSLSGRVIEEALLSPSARFRTQYQEVVNIPTRGLEQQRVLGEQLGQQYRRIQKSVPRKQRQQLVDILTESNHNREVFTHVNGGLRNAKGKFIQATPEMVRAYDASTILMEATYRIANAAEIRVARLVGFQMLDDVIRVKPRPATVGFIDSNGTKVTQAMADEGYKVVDVFDTDLKITQTLAFSPTQMQARVKEIGDFQDLLGFTQGYQGPILYKGNWKIASIRQDEDGKYFVKTEARAQTPKDAEIGIASLIERNGADSDLMYVAVRNNIQPVDIKAKIKGGRIQVRGATKSAKEQITSFVKTLDTDATLHNLSDLELDELAAAMSRAGFGDDVGENLIQEARYFSGPAHTRPRGAERPRDALNLDQPAPQLDLNESVALYWDAVARHANLQEISIELQDKFVRTYGRFLETKNDWSSKVQIKQARELGGIDEGAKAFEAWSVQHQIKVISNMKSAEAKMMDGWVASYRDKMILKKNFRMARTMDKLSDTAGIAGTVKSLGAKGVFGLYSTSHFIIQGMGVLNTVGRAATHDPRDLAKAAKSTLKYVYGRRAKKMGLPMDQETKFVVDFIDSSGYLDGINFAALDNLVGHNVGGVTKQLDRSLILMQKGEATNKLIAFNWNLHNNIRKIRAGKHPLGFTEKDIPTRKFRDFIVNQADLTALNMKRFNQPLFSQGVAGTTFQYKQIVSQMSQLFFGIGGAAGDITNLERFGIWFTTAAVLGPNAIPMGETILATYDNFLALHIQTGNIVIKEGKPQDAGLIKQKFQRNTALFIVDTMKKLGLEGDEQYWRRWTEGGLLTSETGGAIQATDRAALQLMTNTYYDNISPKDVLGPGLNLFSKIILGSVNGTVDLVAAIQSEDGLENSDILKSAKKAFGALGGARNILSTIEALTEGKVTNSTGQAIIDGLSFKEIMMLATTDEKIARVKEIAGVAAGLPPERFRQAIKENEMQARQREAWEEWTDITTRAIYRAAMENNYETAHAILGEATRQVAEFRDTDVAFFIKKGVRAMWVDPNATIEDRNALKRIKFNLAGREEKPLF